MPGPQFQVSLSTNAVDFKAFLETCIARRTDPEPRRPLWVILDGHRAHWTENEGVRDRLTAEDVNVYYLPRGTSWFNALSNTFPPYLTLSDRELDQACAESRLISHCLTFSLLDLG